MAETADQIEQQIVETRLELKDNFNELERRVKSVVDWKRHFEERPGTMLALAFGGGVVLSAILPRRRSGAGRKHSTESGAQRGAAAYRTPSSEIGTTAGSPSETHKTPGEVHKTVEALRHTLSVIAVDRAARFMDSLLPGFHQEFAKAQAGKSQDRSAASDSYAGNVARPGDPSRARASAAGASD